MQLVLLVITLFLTSISSFAVQTFSGYIVQNGNQRSLKSGNQHYVLVADNSDVKTQLHKLRNKDFISGIGNMLGSKIVRLETIDFVGLSNFLGLWMSPMGIFQVTDFSSLSLYKSSSGSGKSALNYSITPADGASWGMFLTDANQIYFSNLTITESKASIRFFDTQTGAFQREVALSKISR
tara:strand:- start:68085 stop:68627 length:543 start_codon:yes stop_codon:yes gene_type:complete